MKNGLLKYVMFFLEKLFLPSAAENIEKHPASAKHIVSKEGKTLCHF
jgi:hypothetical protein